uniref:Uncharacterized protein n=1 Tax=Hucho hucho TaxID=62062 RepID=A0A4W5KYB0_9TELE
PKYRCAKLVASYPRRPEAAIAAKGLNLLTAAKAALVHTCPVPCLSDPKTFKQHSESKHPKSPMVPVLVDVQA